MNFNGFAMISYCFVLLICSAQICSIVKGNYFVIVILY